MQKASLQLFKSIIISGAAVVISYFINFFLTSFITENIGVEAYGFISIARNFVNYATIITVSLTAFTVRHISITYHSGDFEESKSYYSSAIMAFAIVSGILLIAFLFFVWKLEYFINIPNDLRSAVKILFVIVFLNFCVTTITTPFSASSYIKDRLDIAGLIKILSYIIDAAIMVILFMNLTPQVWYVGIGSLTASTVLLIGNIILTKTLTPELKFKLQAVSFTKIKTMAGQGTWNSLNQLGNELNSGLDLLISNWYLSGVATGQISIVKTLGSIFSTLAATVWQPCQPQMIKQYSSQNLSAFLHEVKKAMKVCGIFVALAFAGFIALGQLYLKLWVPSQDSGVLYVLAIWTIANQITEGIMKPIYYINTLTIKNKVPCFVTMGGGVLNVVSMIILLNFTNLGAIAVVSTTAIIMLGINLFFNPIYAAKCLKIKPWIFYKIIARHLAATTALTIIFWLISYVLKPINWLGLILCALLMVIVGSPIYLLIINTPKELKALFIKIWSKFKKHKR